MDDYSCVLLCRFCEALRDKLLLVCLMDSNRGLVPENRGLTVESAPSRLLLDIL